MTTSPVSTVEMHERIRAQHAALKQLLKQIGDCLGQRTATIDQASQLLAQLGDQLIRHFALEESEGTLGDALLRSPQLVRKANELLAQHPKMTLQATRLVQVDLGRTTAGWWEETHRKFSAFEQELLEHERCEDKLLQEAYNRDVEAGD